MTKKPTYEELEKRVKKLKKAVVNHEQMEKGWDVFFECSPDLLCIISFDKKLALPTF